MSDAKPLRWSFLLSIPIVVGAIWGVLLVLAHVERGELVEALTARVSNGSVKEAKAALDQIVQMPEPPLEILVAAATSPTCQVARRAQASISELLRKWQHQLNAKRRVRRIARQLEQLAAELDNDRDFFAARDYPWLAKTTESIVRLANTATPQDAPSLAVHCDSLLARTSPQALSRLAAVVPVASTTVGLAPDSVFSPPTRIALQSIIPDDQASYANDEGVESAPAPHADDGAPDNPLGRPQPSVTDFAPVPLPPLIYRRPRAEAVPPIPEIITSPDQPMAADPWARIGSRALLDRWLVAGDTPKLKIARELERRGFGSLRTDLVRVAVSDDTTGRVQLVHDLLNLPGAGAKAWLRFFARDANAEVRFAAVTVMATSHDPQLLEEAWQLALHDRDPRVAGLADRLRDHGSPAR